MDRDKHAVVRNAANTMVVDRKNQKALALLYLASGLLPNAANSSNVPTEFPAEHNNDEVLEGKLRNLNFSSSSKKTTEYYFKPFFFQFVDNT